MIASHPSGRALGVSITRLAGVSEQAGQPTGPESCTACRGTGSVISNLGGEPHQLACPWCDGGGVVLPGHDAQAHWRAEQGSDER